MSRTCFFFCYFPLSVPVSNIRRNMVAVFAVLVFFISKHFGDSSLECESDLAIGEQRNSLRWSRRLLRLFRPTVTCFFVVQKRTDSEMRIRKKTTWKRTAFFFPVLNLAIHCGGNGFRVFSLKKNKQTKKAKKKTHFTSGSEPERVYLTLHIFSDFTCERNSRLLLLFFYSPSEIARNYRNK